MTETLPARWYHDPSVYEAERRAVFCREWLWFAPEAEVAQPGQYVARSYAGWNLLVLRAPEGTLRGFHNVCRHRAGPLIEDGAGHCTRLVCRYHGWAYDLDGRLRSARDFGGALDHGSDDDRLALLPVEAQTWRGQVFVHLGGGPGPVPTLAGDLAAVFAEVADLPIESMPFSHAVAHDLACNWKTYADNYVEGYHIPLVHPELNREIDAKRYVVETGDRYCRHHAPARAGTPSDGRWLFRWPNLALNVYADGMNVEVIVPTGPTTCTVLYHYFLRDPDDPRHRETMRRSATLMAEDRRIAEAVQHNLETGAYDTGTLSPRHEAGVAQFQGLVRAALGYLSGELSGEPDRPAPPSPAADRGARTRA